MFFKELEFSLEDIHSILKNPKFDLRKALLDHRNLIEIKRKRLNGLLRTIDKTIKKINREKNMTDTELYDGFSKEESEQYAKEAKERWGNTEAYKQSQERYGKLSTEDKKRIHEAGDHLLKEIVKLMNGGASPASVEVQALIATHYDGLRVFYEPNIEMYRGLATMYVDDERFAKTFNKYADGFAVYMRDAMYVFCGEK
jgi:DNA-binding transcriptional MerR regulator